MGTASGRGKGQWGDVDLKKAASALSTDLCPHLLTDLLPGCTVVTASLLLAWKTENGSVLLEYSAFGVPHSPVAPRRRQRNCGKHSSSPVVGVGHPVEQGVELVEVQWSLGEFLQM